MDVSLRDVLGAFDRAGGWCRERELARHLDAEFREVHLAVAALEKRGYIERYYGGTSGSGPVYRPVQKES